MAFPCRDAGGQPAGSSGKGEGNIWTAAITPTSSVAHKGMVAGAKVLAASVLDLLTSDDLRQKAMTQFQEDTKEAKPPLDLNREMMEKYRPEMRQFYLNKRVQFR